MTKQAVLIDQHTISFMEASVKREKIHVKAFIRLPRGDFNSSDPSDSQAFGKMLRDELVESGLRAKDAAVALSSPLVIQRHLTLPKTRKSDLPAVVQLQVEAMPLIRCEDFVCDYALQSQTKEQTNVSVLISSRSALQSNVLTIEQSGFRVESVTSASNAIVSFLRHALPQSLARCDLVVLGSDRRIELVALRDSQIIASHTEAILNVSGDRAELIHKAASRFVKALQRSDEHYSPQHAIALLDDPLWATVLVDQLQQQFKIQADCPDYRAAISLSQKASRSKRCDSLSVEAVILSGILLAESGSDLQKVNLVKPKRVKSKLLQRSVLAAVAASLIGLIGYFGYEELRLRERETNSRWASLRQQVDRLTEKNQKSRELLQRADVVGNWEDGHVDWLGELAGLRLNLPKQNEAYLRELEFQVDAASELPTARAVGFAKRQLDVMEMNRRLTRRGSRYELDPRPFFQNDQAEPFIHQFELELSLAPPSRGKESGKTKSSTEGQVGVDVVEESEKANLPVSNDQAESATSANSDTVGVSDPTNQSPGVVGPVAVPSNEVEERSDQQPIDGATTELDDAEKIGKTQLDPSGELGGDELLESNDEQEAKKVEDDTST